jgi:hypothetical protein
VCPGHLGPRRSDLRPARMGQGVVATPNAGPLACESNAGCSLTPYCAGPAVRIVSSVGRRRALDSSRSRILRSSTKLVVSQF